jgi:hypothetical protein
MRAFAVLSLVCGTLAAQSTIGPSLSQPTEKLVFDVEWRLIHAGQATLESRPNWARMRLESAGLVSALFKVDDTYAVNYEDPFCATLSTMDSQEGRRHHSTVVQYDRGQNHAFFTERDVLKNELIRSLNIPVPHCVHDVVGALLTLRRIAIQPGTTIELPVSDGRRAANVKVYAQEREEIVTKAGKFKTIRFEADILNGVVYQRKGKAQIWISDDAKRLPVQIRLRMSFPIGTVTLGLEKEGIE